MEHEPPPGSSSSPPKSRKKASRSQYSAAVGFVTGLSAVLSTLGLILLPSSTTGEKVLIFFASLALSVAAWTGHGAWASPGRFAATMGSVLTSLTLLGVLITVVTSADSDDLALRGNPTSGPTPTDAPGETSRGDPTVPSASSPSEPTELTPNPTPSSAQPDDGDALYLADVNGAEWPPGSWTLGDAKYPESLGVNLGCEAWSEVSLKLGHPYRKLVATVHIDGPILDAERDVRLNVVVYDDRNGDGGIQQGQEFVELFDLRPGARADVNILFEEPVSNLILGVGIANGGCLHSEVVWAAARVLP